MLHPFATRITGHTHTGNHSKEARQGGLFPSHKALGGEGDESSRRWLRAMTNACVSQTGLLIDKQMGRGGLNIPQKYPTP